MCTWCGILVGNPPQYKRHIPERSKLLVISCLLTVENDLTGQRPSWQANSRSASQ